MWFWYFSYRCRSMIYHGGEGGLLTSHMYFDSGCMEAYIHILYTCMQVAWEIWVIFLKYLIFTLGTKINILEIPNDKLG